jgi:hypothetical protein
MQCKDLIDRLKIWGANDQSLLAKLNFFKGSRFSPNSTNSCSVFFIPSKFYGYLLATYSAFNDFHFTFTICIIVDGKISVHKHILSHFSFLTLSSLNEIENPINGDFKKGHKQSP